MDILRPILNFIGRTWDEALVIVVIALLVWAFFKFVPPKIRYAFLNSIDTWILNKAKEVVEYVEDNYVKLGILKMVEAVARFKKDHPFISLLMSDKDIEEYLERAYQEITDFALKKLKEQLAKEKEKARVEAEIEAIKTAVATPAFVLSPDDVPQLGDTGPSAHESK